MIKIEIGEAKKVNGNYAGFISFPYDLNILNTIRELPDRAWNKDDKTWEVPLNRLTNLIHDLSSYEIQIKSYVEETSKPAYELPKGFKFLTTPYDHQKDGFQYGMENDRFLLGDEPGLGKTKQVIDIAMAKRITRGYKHCLIIPGINGLKWNWYDECKIHANEVAHILGVRYNSKGKPKSPSNASKMEDLNNLPNNFFLITNVESLRSPEISAKLKELCDSGEIGMVAIDEIHKCKNPTSQQGKGILKVQPECRIAMTGTPILEKPLDAYIILRWLGYEKHSFYQFKKYFCRFGGFGGHEVIGYKNISELKNNLNSIQLRRRKKDVLDLPDKVRTVDYVEMNRPQQLIYDEIKMAIVNNIDLVKRNPNPLAQLIRLRQATGYTGILSSKVEESAKLERMEEIVEEVVANGHKVLVYSNWTDMTDEMTKRFTKMGITHGVITGQYSSEQNHETEHWFQEDPNCKVCLGTIEAMGTGFTLTAATYIIFVDEPWNQKIKEQAEDRAHRIGTTEALNIVTLITKDSIDERIADIVVRKGVMADAIVDGNVPMDSTSVIDFLLS